MHWGPLASTCGQPGEEGGTGILEEGMMAWCWQVAVFGPE